MVALGYFFRKILLVLKNRKDKCSRLTDFSSVPHLLDLLVALQTLAVVAKLLQSVCVSVAKERKKSAQAQERNRCKESNFPAIHLIEFFFASEQLLRRDQGEVACVEQDSLLHVAWRHNDAEIYFPRNVHCSGSSTQQQ